MPTEDVGVVGSGAVGKALARGFASRDSAVTIGTRSPETLEEWRAETPGAIDVGDIESSRYIEALVPLWVRIGAEYDTWEHAFSVGR